MPPSPGRIQDLPVKILYNIDTTSQSYVTVLPERQPVFVHTVAPAQAQDESGMGSCYLKAAVRGICFASPECIPNSSSLDFSVYNLDPSLRNRQARAFPPAAQASLVLDDSWTGKGFLSWILTENGTGKTLIKGRLVRDIDFATSAFNEQGGLEGLVAAAASRTSQRDDLDGKGWGLEVCLSLKMINPEGKDEFRGRREFEEMLRRGTAMASVTSVAVQGIVASSPASIAASTPRANPQNQNEPIRRNPPSSAPRNSTIPNLPHSSSNTSTQSVRPSPAHHQSATLPPPPRPMPSSSRTSTSSSLPPSSLPMQASSSAGPSSLPPPPPRHSSSAPVHVHPPRSNGHSSSVPLASSSTHVAASSSRNQSREVTPPPVPQRKSPPPSTPSRERLAALIRTDEKMSPSMAKQLAQNPVLLKLLKAVPPGGLSSMLGNGHAESSKHSPDSGGAPTPTPIGPPAPASKATNAVTDPAEGCCNCGAMTTDIWRTKNMKDGTKKKVCNACGLYFNKHKRMRPPELWGTTAHDDPPPDKRPKLEEPHQPVRCSPRLHRNVSDHNHPPPVPSVAESPRKRKTTKPIPQPSPRMTTRSSTRHDGNPPNFTQMEGKQLDFSDNLFSPATMFGTSPAQPLPNPALGVDMVATTSAPASQNGLAMENPFDAGDLDIEALLNQIAAADGTNGFSLEAFFANTDANAIDGNVNGLDGGSLFDMAGWNDTSQTNGANGSTSNR